MWRTMLVGLGAWCALSVAAGLLAGRMFADPPPRRLVAWGGRPGFDVQIGSWEDMTRLCEQLIEAANASMARLVCGFPVLALETGSLELFVVAGSSPAAVGKITNLGV